jgi:hypothetical protein
MRNVTSALSFVWESQPEARVGYFYSPTAGEGAFEGVAVPYPLRRRKPARPLEVEIPRLFLDLAALTDGAAALHFAMEWGLLWGKLDWLTLEPASRSRERQAVEWAGQSLKDWLRAGAEMREAVALSRAICQQDRKAMGAVVSIVPRGHGGRSVPLYAGVRGGISLLQPLPRSSLTDAARMVLAKLVNDRDGAAHQLRYDGARPHKLAQILRPQTLLGAARGARWPR